MDQLEYPESHWARDCNPTSALSRRAELSALPFNVMEWETFTSLLPPTIAGLSILDYGCGVGDLSLYCARRGGMVTGVDRSEAALAAARHQAEAEGLSNCCHFETAGELEGRQYDLVLAKDVIEHIEDDERWVASVARVLKPSGTFIFSTHNDRCLNYLIERTYHRTWRGDKT